MDTTIITIANGLLAICSVIALVINIHVMRSDRKERIEEGWHKVRNARKIFWENSRRGYKEYCKQYPSITKDLQTLINQAGMPPNAPGNREAGKIAWESSNFKRLTPEQTYMYNFAKTIYPERTGDADSQAELSVLNHDQFEQLDSSRREFDSFFMFWGKRLKTNIFVDTFDLAKDDCILLCWYDLALIRWTYDDGIGDPTIYELGYQYASARKGNKR